MSFVATACEPFRRIKFCQCIEMSILNTIQSNKRGFKFYVIPPGTTLYRGFPRVDQTGRPVKPVLDNYHFVTTNKEAAKTYGVPFPIVTDRQYKLVALDQLDTRNLLYTSSSSPDIQRILSENYGHTTGFRDSVFKNDVIFSKHLCTLGFDGYATKTMKNRDEGREDFHEELMFCDTSHLQIGETDLTDKEIEQIVWGMEEKKLSRDMKTKRRSKRKKSKSPSPHSPHVPSTLGSPQKSGYKTPGGRGRGRHTKTRRRPNPQRE